MLTIAERRTVSERTLDRDFRELFRRDPRGAITVATGRALPVSDAIEVLEESADAWSFVLIDPAGIDRTLPEPQDARYAVENHVYALLRDEPALMDIAERDPTSFLRERLGVEVAAIDIRREGKNQTIVVLPHLESREELSENLLDLVAGGNDPGCQSGHSSQDKKAVGLDNLGATVGVTGCNRDRYNIS